MNKGLKNYTKHLTHTVGSATADINLFERDANTHITIPLISTKGLNPFSTKLIFNFQDKDNLDYLFGYGTRLNYYAKISVTSTTVTVSNADGSSYTYELDQWHPETQMKVTKVYTGEYNDAPNYEFEDRDGNRIIYESLSEYPSRIQMKSGDLINFNFIGNTKTISNGKGDKITFSPDANGRIGSVIYSYNNGYSEMVLERVDLLYEYNTVANISYKTAELIETAQTQMDYLGSKIVLIDAKSGHRSEFNFSNNRLSSIRDGYGANYNGCKTTIFDYYENQASVTNWDDTYVDYYFDSDGIPLYSIDNRGYAIETEYNSTTKNLMAQSNPFLIKGTQKNYFEGMSMANFVLDNVTREAVTLTENKWKNLVGETVYKFSHSGSGWGTISFEVPVDCVATDNVMAVLWARQKSNYTSNNYSVIDMQIGDGDWAFLSKPQSDSNFELIFLGATCKKTEATARFLITLFGDTSFELGGIQLVRQDFGAFYNYDSENGKISLLSRAGEVAKRSYNKENQLNSSTEFDTTINVYDYNDKGYPVKATSAHGIEITYGYEASDPSLLTKQTLIDKEDNKIIEVKKEYSWDGRHVTKEYDELGICVSNVTYENDKPKTITNAKGVKTTFDYEHDLVMSMLLEKDSVELSKATYTYYEDSRRLKTVTLKNGSVYEFIYDFRGNISTIKLNGIIIFSYYYEESTGNLLSIWYGLSSERYDFYYTWDNLIQDIYFVPDGRVGLHRFYYSYDAKTRLLDHIEDENGNTLIAYEYDSEGKVIKNTQQNHSILEYSYDNLGNINSLLRKVQNKIVHESYVNATRSQSSHPEIMAENFGDGNYFGLFDEDAMLRSESSELEPMQNGATLGKDGMIPYANIGANKPLVYHLNDSPNGDLECGCVKFWFKPSNIDNTQYMFGIQGTHGDYIEVYLEEQQMRVGMRDWYGKYHNVITGSGRVVNNKWNFFALNFYFRDDEGSNPNCEISLTINNDTRFYTEKDSIPKVDLVPTYYIGRKYDGSNYFPFEGKITCLAIEPRLHSSLENIYRFYNISKDFIDDCQYIDDYENTVDVSETIAFVPSSNSYKNFEIYPLNNNLLSLSGKRPTKFSGRRGVVMDNEKAFNFNPMTKRYAYVADGSELIYSFGQSNSGTIMMRVYTEFGNNSQYLFEGKDAHGKMLSLRRNSSNYLVVNCEGNDWVSGLQMSNEAWHTVALSFTRIITGDSESETISGSICVFVDGQTATTTMPISFSSLEFAIGRRYHEELVIRCTGRERKCYPFYGQIEMLCANNAYVNSSTLNNLMQEIKPIVKTNEFDDFGRVKQSCVIKGDTKLIDKTITYVNRPGDSRYTSERVVDEDFMVFSNSGSGGFNRSYTYDNLGNVTAISDNTIGSHTYEYDDRGFLVRDDTTTFAYDGNGNITQKGNVTFTYDSTMKDKLVSVGGKAITYSTNNVLAPISYDGKNFAYEGKRLIGFTDANSDSYMYEYNDQGQRIRKSTPNGLIKYVYSGNKLIAEIAPWHMLNFLYDENDQLYGFDIDSTGTYFYLRDSLQNIIGIIDSYGDLVVKYNYTAYGECTIMLNSEGIAEINPFRYKGYYYDQESGMYYCNSRYYVPEWCRWLTPDSPSFLQPESLNGMNLFAYCGNDPVNNIDSNGNFPVIAGFKRIKKAITGFKAFGKWVYNNIGFANTMVESIGYKQHNSILGRVVVGAELAGTINNGDFNKPITFFSQGTHGSGYLSELRTGVSINKGNGGIEFSLSLNVGFNFSIDFGGTSVELSLGALESGIKISSGTDFKNKTAESYSAIYFRPIVLALVFVGISTGAYYPTGSGVPVY